VLALFAATYGIIDRSIYDGLLPANFVAAQLPQDILTVLVCVGLIWLSLTTKKDSVVKPIIIMGMLGSLAYLYGIFSIERVYNVMYLVYLAILGTSIYGALYTLASIDREKIQSVTVPKNVRQTTAVFSLFIAVMFSFLWVSALVPLMAEKNQIENLYSIYLLDLVFVMPTLAITAIMTFRRKVLGYLLTPMMHILGIFVIFPLGLGELAKPFYHQQMDVKSMVMSFVLSGLFIVGAAWQLAKVKRAA
jgi:hypothetical protein